MTDAERIERLENKVGEAYQIVGWLLAYCDLFETKDGQRVLDYFSREDDFADDILPWPKDLPPNPRRAVV